MARREKTLFPVFPFSGVQLMYIKTLGEFYTTTANTLYRGQINYKILTNKQLDKIIEDGLVTFNKMYAHKDRGFFEAFAIVALCVVAVAAIAVVAAGSTAAGAGAVSATTGAGTATATGIATGAGTATGTTVATSAAATSAGSVSFGTQVMTAVKSAASYVATTVKKKATDAVENTPEALEKAAKEIVTEKANKEAMEAFGYGLDARGQKIEDPAVMAALQERLRREQITYAEYLKRQAAEMRKAQNKPAQQPKTNWLYAAIPVALYLIAS